MIRRRLGLMIGLLGLAAWLASAGLARASIQISQSETFALFAVSSVDNDMSSSTGDDDEKQQPVQPDQLQEQLAAPIDGSGMTSSSSVATGTSGAQALPASSPVFQQEPLSGRLAGEAKLILPAPFILGLLRPPRILS